MASSGWKSSVSRHLSLSELPVPEWLPKAMRDSFPRSRLQLASTPTVIHPWLKLQNGQEVFIKRDDQTGSLLSGNKVRKLEFIMTDLLNKGCDTVITCGSLQSNHCRAVAVVAAQLGLECHLLLRTDVTKLSDVPMTANFLLNNLAGAYQYLVGPKEQYATGLLPRAQKLADVLRRERERKSYIIPVGGSDMVGVFGYFVAFDEIFQTCPSSIRNIFVACGSGGTLAGLAISNFLNGSRFKIYGVPVCDDAAYFYDHVQKMVNDLGLSDARVRDMCHVIDGYKGAGYGVSSEEEREFIREITAETGIFLDPVYTGKAARGMLTELGTRSACYQGDSLFIHTGGVFGIFGEKGFGQPVGRSDMLGDGSWLPRTALWKDASQEPAVLQSTMEGNSVI